jgi:hypothetical protein
MNGPPKTSDPRPYIVTVYHVACIVGSVCIAFSLQFGPWSKLVLDIKHQLLALDLGVLGGAISASRYVVYSVRHCDYDPNRLLWQIMTPIYSGPLAWVGLLCITAGIITLTSPSGSSVDAGSTLASGRLAEPQFTAFIAAFSFLVGFASEAFVKRLIMAAESLFGERGDLDRR